MTSTFFPDPRCEHRNANGWRCLDMAGHDGPHHTLMIARWFEIVGSVDA